MQRRAWSLKVLLPLALALAFGCADKSKTTLKPAASAQNVPGMPEAAKAQSNVASLVAEIGKWPGEKSVGKKVTPVHIVLENTGTQPILVRYRSFAIVAQDGSQKFAALPPFQITSDFVAPAVIAKSAPITPKWTAMGFELDPAYATLYRGIGVADEPLDFDNAYYNAYYPSIRETELPAGDAQKFVLPEGILNPGGRLDGYLLFEKVPKDQQTIMLNAALMSTAEDSPEIGRLSVPFTATKEKD